MRILVWAIALWLLWLVLVGTTQSTELAAGGIAAVVTVIFVEALRARGLLDFAPSLRIVARAWVIAPHLFFDFALVLWILVRNLAHGRRVRGQWVEIEYPLEPGAAGRFQRALVAALENETPNAIVVDLDRERALLHALDTRPSTGRSVL
jgi:multisubunit Na+/H+ antiporter MnhE subunit